MKKHKHHDTYTQTLQQLLQDVSELRQQVIADAEQRLAPFAAYYHKGHFSHSARNLAHYLALRQRDLRPLQQRLAEVGLSSLGRGEAHILANLDRILELLHHALGKQDKDANGLKTNGDFIAGERLLSEHIRDLFGPAQGGHGVRIMVTLPGEAAGDYALIRVLVEEGMDCARINCAHDEPPVWLAMVEHIRRAERETGHECRILMDLAGYKLRTGPIRLGPAVRRLRVQRDAYGHVVAPAAIILENGFLPLSAPPTSAIRLAIPEPLHSRLAKGDRLAFIDSRDKARFLDIIDHTEAHAWLAHCHHSAYLTADTELTWLRPDPDGIYHAQDSFRLVDFPGEPETVRLFMGEHLLLKEGEGEGKPAQYDAAGHLTAVAEIFCAELGVIQQLKPGELVLIDDGKLTAEVEGVDEKGAYLRVIHAAPRGVCIRSDKGMNFPNTDLQLAPLSDKDLSDLGFVCEHADMVGFSFVESLADLEQLMAELDNRGMHDMPIIAKIETNKAVRHLPEMILGSIGRHRLGIMIARGDLAVELGSVRLAEIQEEILWLCEAAHVPVIWATQVLETMAKKGIRSRPEITDAAMSGRADCVMLNKGPYILDALRALVNIVKRMEDHQHKKFSRLRKLHW